MDKLAQAISLVQQAHRGFTTAAGKASWWTNGGVQEAIRRHRRPEMGREHVRSGPDQWGEGNTLVEQFWAEPPHRLRLERHHPEPQRLPGVVVVSATQWWKYDPDSGAESNFGDPSHSVFLGWIPDLLDPAAILGSLHLEWVGDDDVAGHRALHLRGRERKTLRRVHGPHSLAMDYADRYDLWFHADTGVCLRAVSVLDDHPFWLAEFTDIEFDGPIEADRFVFESPQGVEVHPTRPRTGAG